MIINSRFEGFNELRTLLKNLTGKEMKRAVVSGGRKALTPVVRGVKKDINVRSGALRASYGITVDRIDPRNPTFRDSVTLRVMPRKKFSISEKNSAGKMEKTVFAARRVEYINAVAKDKKARLAVHPRVYATLIETGKTSDGKTPSSKNRGTWVLRNNFRKRTSTMPTIMGQQVRLAALRIVKKNKAKK